MLSLEEFIKKLSYSEYTSNLLHILNNKRYGEGGELFDHKKGDVISLLLKIVDGNIPTTSSKIEYNTREFIKKLFSSEYTNNLLYILNNKRYGERGELFNHKKDNLISLLLKIVDEISIKN